MVVARNGEGIESSKTVSFCNREGKESSKTVTSRNEEGIESAKAVVSRNGEEENSIETGRLAQRGGLNIIETKNKLK
jgi:hypothetical protein